VSLLDLRGAWHGRVRMAEDFDALPDDIADAFGVRTACPCSGERQRSCSTERTLPAGSRNQAMYGPPARMMPRSSCSKPS
jgi:hypothetical protein